MPTYRYYTFDLLTNGQLGLLPLSGVSFSRVLSGSGAWNASLFMRDPRVNTAIDYDTITKPKRTALYIDRDGTLVYGGIIWNRSYQKSSRVWQLSGSTFDSYLAYRLINSAWGYTNQDLLTIAAGIWTHLQNDDPSSNIGVAVPSPIPVLGETGTVSVDPTQQRQTYQNIIQQLYSGDPGFDWTIFNYWNQQATPQVPAKLLRLGAPRLGATAAQTGLIFRHPGNVIDYTWPEDGTRSPNHSVGVGGGSGATALTSSQYNESELNGGYPLIEDTLSFKDVFDQARLDSLTRGHVNSVNSIVTTPQLVLRPDCDNPALGSYGEGDSCRVVIDPDERFPRGYDGFMRLTSLSVATPDRGKSEKVTLTLGPAI